MELPKRQFIQLGTRNRSTSRQKASSQHKIKSIISREVSSQQLQGTNLPKDEKQNVFSSLPMKTVFTVKHSQNTQILPNTSRMDHKIPLMISPYKIRTDRQNSMSKRVHFSTQNQTNHFQKDDLVTKVLWTEKRQDIILPVNIIKRQETVTRNVTAPLFSVTERESQLVRKVKTLEGRIIQLNTEKLNTQQVLTEENRKLFHQNQYLKKKLEESNSEQIQDRLTQISSMLEKQIMKSLQLMEQNDTLKKQIQDMQSQLLSKQALYTAVQQQLQIVNTKGLTLDSQITHLHQQLKQKNAQILSLSQEPSAEFHQKIETLVLQNQSLLDQVSQKILLLQNFENEKQQFQVLRLQKDEEIANLTQKLHAFSVQIDNGLNISNMQKSKNFGMSASSWGCESSKSEGRHECVKCQDLLRTVFKLNSQLNKHKPI